MIHKLDINANNCAEDVLAVQLPSYLAEAELIGCFDLPPLQDTVHSLQQSGETFYGYYTNGELCGVISIQTDGEVMEIQRLIVHPAHFRKGIA
ncbi:GNAT family N-acetyltransferase [Sporosarcina sp. P33]|uniref:GNAT family N-acetyltransferase n=1 Tax=Sporosarcina sp. P33 TaxID=1930764 RepID=UPI0035174A10